MHCGDATPAEIAPMRPRAAGRALAARSLFSGFLTTARQAWQERQPPQAERRRAAPPLAGGGPRLRLFHSLARPVKQNRLLRAVQGLP